MLSVRKGLVAELGRMRKAAMQRFGEKQAGRQGEQQVRGEGRLGPRSEGRRSGVWERGSISLPPVENGHRDKSLLVEFDFLKQGMCYSERYKNDFEKMELAE